MKIPAKVSRKEIRNELSKTLFESLNGLKDSIKKEKMEKNIKKASKILLIGVKISKLKKKTHSKNQPITTAKKDKSVKTKATTFETEEVVTP